MNNYSHFQVKDWLDDLAFQRWVYHGEQDGFWKEFVRNNPGQLANIEQAREILLAVRGELDALPEPEVKLRVSEILNAIPDDKLRALPWWRSNWLKMAAMLLLALGIVTALFREKESLQNLQTFVAGLRDGDKPDELEVYNETHAIQLVNLPDGSSVILKKHARISYPAAFLADRREVTLRGEAFFEVVKNPEQPFFVYAGSMVTKVKGTSFSIKANDDDEDVELVVKTGVVEVSALENEGKSKSGAGKKLILKPNEQVTFNRKSLNMIAKTVQKPVLLNLPAESQNFEFRRTPLAEVFAALEQTYGIDIQFDAKTIAYCTLTAKLGDEPVYEKLDLICAVVNARYEMRVGPAAGDSAPGESAPGTVVAVTSEGCE
ncbi:FecR family protein [Dyadobacter soli]|uniref:FecR family protein n=1 Tax=Dyadobacter soli TaxID=659014 RepID=A0A1G7ZZG4_9BACT|nr:FecR family protein [Dyadobacter soli]SDH14099.1 FecR family protein [Dyadobacter soli]